MDETTKELTKQLAEAYAQVAEAEAKRTGKGEEEVRQELRQQLAQLTLQFECSTSLGYCTCDGSISHMSECDCIMYGCTGYLSVRGGRTGSRPTWQSAPTVFGRLAQVLAEIYAQKLTAEQANEQVIRDLCGLIKQANGRGSDGLGTCTIELTRFPIVIPATKEECQKIPGGKWQAG